LSTTQHNTRSISQKLTIVEDTLDNARYTARLEHGPEGTVQESVVCDDLCAVNVSSRFVVGVDRQLESAVSKRYVLGREGMWDGSAGNVEVVADSEVEVTGSATFCYDVVLKEVVRRYSREECSRVRASLSGREVDKHPLFKCTVNTIHDVGVTVLRVSARDNGEQDQRRQSCE
jgi:hypothetical protein